MNLDTRAIVEISLLILFATLHGYAGAWLAVRMLFRPRYPVKLFGLTIFPQGMIPRHRDRLASAIGKAVGEELVSQETVLEELFQKEFLRKKIQSVVDSYTEQLLLQEYPSLIEALPANLREPVLDTIASLQRKIGDHIQDVLKSEETAQSIGSFVERRVDEFLSKRVSEVVDERQFNQILDFLENRVKTILQSPALEKQIGDFLNKQVDNLSIAKTTLGEFVKPDTVELIKEKAGEQIEPIIQQLSQIAASEKTRNQIGALIKKEVHEYYENLAFFKKIFVSRENLINEVDDLVNDSLPKRIEETLRGDYFAQEAKSFINSSIDNAMSRPLDEIAERIAPEQLNRFKTQIRRSVVSLLQGDAVQTSVSAYLTDSLHKIRPHSLDAILQTLYPESEEKLKKMLSKGLLNVLTQDETAKIINGVLAKQIDKLLAAPIGKLSNHISEEQVRKAGGNLTETIISAAREKLPQVIQEFDLGNVVREKIDNYPVEKLESLVLSVAKEHLRKIELFGAFFGLLIGLIQTVMTLWIFPWLFGK